MKIKKNKKVKKFFEIPFIISSSTATCQKNANNHDIIGMGTRMSQYIFSFNIIVINTIDFQIKAKKVFRFDDTTYAEGSLEWNFNSFYFDRNFMYFYWILIVD